MPFREVSNTITTINCPKCLFHYSHFGLHIIVIFHSNYNHVLDSKSQYVSFVTLSTTRIIENTYTNNWNWKWRIFIWWLCWICAVVEPAAIIKDPSIHRICQLGSVPSVWTLGTPEILCSTTSCKKGYNNCVSSLQSINLLSLKL